MLAKMIAHSLSVQELRKFFSAFWQNGRESSLRKRSSERSRWEGAGWAGDELGRFQRC